MRKTPVLFVLACVAASFAQTPEETARKQARLHSCSLHEVRIPGPDAGRREAVPLRLRPQGHLANLSDPDAAHALLRRAVWHRQLPPSLGPSESAEKEGFIFVYPDVRGRYLSEGTFVDVPPHKTHFKDARDTDESTDTYDTIDWLVKNVPNNNGKVGIWGISYPGFFAAFGLIGLASGAEGGVTAGPHGRRRQRRRRAITMAPFTWRELRFLQLFIPRNPIPSVRSRPRVRFGTLDAYDFYLRMGADLQRQRTLPQEQNVYWNDLAEAPQLTTSSGSRAHRRRT